MFDKFLSLSSTKQVSLLGAIFGIVGAFIMVMDHLRPVNSIVNFFSPWSELKQAQSTLDRNSRLYPNDEGFSELLDVIRARSGLSTSRIEMIIKVKGMSIRVSETGDVPFYTYHAVDSRGRVIGLGQEGAFLDWTQSYRDKSFLFWGFLFVLLGFLFSAVSHFMRDEERELLSRRTFNY